MNTIAEFLGLLRPTDIIELNSGDYLFRQNNTARGIFLVKKGCVKLLRDSVDGNTVIMYIAQSNDSLAEASLFSSHYHCHAKSDSRAQVFFYDKETVLTYLSADTALAFDFIEVLSKQIQRLRLLIELRGVRSPKERFVQYLRLMVDSNRELQIKSTYKDLAETLGMTHETFYRLLRQLEQDKLITRRDNTIMLSV